MKKMMIMLCLLLGGVAMRGYCQQVKDSVYRSDVHAVYLVRNGVDLSAPYVRMDSDDRLLLRFDVLGEQPEDFRYRIRHCNWDWEVDALDPIDYVNGFEEGAVENYQLSFTTMQSYVNYYQVVPSRYTSFVASGNYLLEVFLADVPDSIILTRRFWVYEDEAAVEMTVGTPTTVWGNVKRDQELSVVVAARSTIVLQPAQLKVMAQQNGRSDMVRTLPFAGYQQDKLAYRWQQSNVFPGGNTFRYFDISNLHSAMYHVARLDSYGGESFAILQPDEDRSRKPYTTEQVLNGGSKVNIVNRNNPQIEADYVWVNFSLPLKQPYLDGGVYIVGDLTNWLFNEESRMEWNPKYKAYTKQLLLKQGYYSYQLIYKRIGEAEGRTDAIEGDHCETPNVYTVYVYLRAPAGRYDRLIGMGVQTAGFAP